MCCGYTHQWRMTRRSRSCTPRKRGPRAALPRSHSQAHTPPATGCARRAPGTPRAPARPCHVRTAVSPIHRVDCVARRRCCCCCCCCCIGSCSSEAELPRIATMVHPPPAAGAHAGTARTHGRSRQCLSRCSSSTNPTQRNTSLRPAENVASQRQSCLLSCLVLSCLVLSCLVLSCLVLSCLVLSQKKRPRTCSARDRSGSTRAGALLPGPQLRARTSLSLGSCRESMETY